MLTGTMPDYPAPTNADLSKTAYMVEAANSGLKIFGGYLFEEFDPNLRGIKGARTYREMADSSPTIGAVLFIITQVISKLGWHLQPKDQTPLSLLAAEYFESLLNDMEHTWDDLIQDVLSMVTYGYAPVEITLKLRSGTKPDKRFSSRYDDGMVGIRKLAIRSQETVLRWLMDQENNTVLGMVQMPWTGGTKTIPRSKMLLFRTRHFRNNPEGRSLLRNSYRPYYFSKRIEEIEGIGIERDLAGFPVMYVPAELIAAATGAPGQPPDPDAAKTLAAYQALVKDLKRNNQDGAVLPSDRDDHGQLLYELKLLTSGGRRQFDTNMTIERYQQQIAAALMADFLLMGHGAGRSGGNTLSGDKVAMFFEAIAGLVGRIVDVFNAELVPLMGRVNSIPQENWPEFFTDKPEQVDLGKLGAYINALAASGMTLFPNEDLEDYLLGIAGLPEPSDETREEQSQLQTSGAEQGMPGTGGTAQPPGAALMGHNGGPPMGGGPGADSRQGAQGSFGQKPPVGGGGGSSASAIV